MPENAAHQVWNSRAGNIYSESAVKPFHCGLLFCAKRRTIQRTAEQSNPMEMAHFSEIVTEYLTVLLCCHFTWNGGYCFQIFGMA